MRTHLTQIYTSFYMQVLHKIYEGLSVFDNWDLTHLAKTNIDEFEKIFFTPERVSDIYEEMKILSDDYSIQPSDIELAFLKKIATLIFTETIENQLLEIESELYTDDWYKNVVFQNSYNMADVIKKEYDWYYENINSDSYVDTLEKSLFDRPYLVAFHERNLLKIDDIAKSMADDHRYIFKNLK